MVLAKPAQRSALAQSGAESELNGLDSGRANLGEDFIDVAVGHQIRVGEEENHFGLQLEGIAKANMWSVPPSGETASSWA